MREDVFSSRWGIILASLGMAIGAGNLWRFPRLAGQYGGTFILLWIVFLLVWSIPLLLTEFAIGRKIRKGVIGSVALIAGRRWAWLGFFITFCTLGIAFYYSVVTAWALRYLVLSVETVFTLSSRMAADPMFLERYWQDVSNGSSLTILAYLLVIGAGVFVIGQGIRSGLEKANRILIPSLFVLLIIIMVVSLNMPGGVQGLEYMFRINPSLFAEPVVWIEALSQSAWSTGAGWGLLMTLSAYSREKEEIAINTFVGAFGNNTASIIAGMAILPAVFATSSSSDAISFLQSGNQALTFTIIPKLFVSVAGGGFLTITFFLALSLAAFTSFLSMIELLIKNLLDLGLSRSRGIVMAVIVFALFGFPSAYYIEVFNNQDWVWGLGLVVSGFILLFVVARYGAANFLKENITIYSGMNINNMYFRLCIFINLILAPVLIYWWLTRGYSKHTWFSSSGWWNVLDSYSNATVVTQWGAVILLGVLLNRFLYNKFAVK